MVKKKQWVSGGGGCMVWCGGGCMVWCGGGCMVCCGGGCMMCCGGGVVLLVWWGWCWDGGVVVVVVVKKVLLVDKNNKAMINYTTQCFYIPIQPTSYMNNHIYPTFSSLLIKVFISCVVSKP